MNKILDVYINLEIVGQLCQELSGKITFTYLQTWLNQANAIPLSHSLPLRSSTFTHSECSGFFNGLLPEADKRKLIARILGISAQNDFALLALIGGECAGAVTFMPSGHPLPNNEHDYLALPKAELANMIRSLPAQPLMAANRDIRLSLAGAQDKMAVHVNRDIISLPLHGAASTHILKPAIAHYEGLVFNEAYCMSLATKLGLPTAEIEIRSVNDIPFLLVKRYDRTDNISRLHQEDFCQALGIPSNMKYQNEGGPTIKQCITLLRETSAVPVIDLQHFLQAISFNWLIGNHDAHGKNFSLLYDSKNGSVRLAPLYDLVSTIYYPSLSLKMAMKIGGEYQSQKITSTHFEKLAIDNNLGKAALFKQIKELAENLLAALSDIPIEHPVCDELGQILRKRCEQYLLKL